MKRILSGLALSAVAFSAQAAMDFEGLPVGTGVAITSQIPGVTISATGGQNKAFVYDTTQNGADPDLTGPFINVDDPNGARLNAGLVLIIQENNRNTPDDNAGGGTLTLDFDKPTTAISIDVFDVDPRSTVKLFDAAGSELGNYGLQDTDTNSSPNFFERVFFNGNIGISNVSSIQVNFSRSGAIDNVATVPLPAAAWLFGSGLIGLATLKRRKKQERT